MNKIEEKRKLVKSSVESLENSLIQLGGEDVLITTQRQKILSLPSNTLLQNLANGTFTACQVLQAFQAQV